MKKLWCWRCKSDVVMLDDNEFKSVSSLLNTGTGGDVRERMFGPVVREYERITGVAETNPNAIFHHVLCEGMVLPVEPAGSPSERHVRRYVDPA